MPDQFADNCKHFSHHCCVVGSQATFILTKTKVDTKYEGPSMSWPDNFISREMNLMVALCQTTVVTSFYHNLMHVSWKFEPHIKCNCHLWLLWFFWQIIIQDCKFHLQRPLKRCILVFKCCIHDDKKFNFN